ncbi:iron-containing alcohol dehydrogenase [Streptomyces incarnatus]|uniref:Iron-containing alcohol dehydrogenase n=1 Tax=Streptomyces incarnatus TaxID=665007 RepID=A0ABM5TGY5_9ACTN|nr:iron-containing alcohol dehydrogenase [Streptomyces incarnatus]AKJ10250.1 iron-containing alcohol dehydrogenase [Streptomyces incarnatus]
MHTDHPHRTAAGPGPDLALDLPVPTRAVFGRGTLDLLGSLAAPLGGHALLVCGRTAMRRHGYLDRAEASLRAAGVAVTVFDGVSADPRSDEADAALAVARAGRCDLVVGLGGGSAIDAAKAVAVAGDHDTVRDLIGTTLPAHAVALPLIAVPTTAGSGSEVTKGAILTDVVRGFKSGIRGDGVAPRVAVVDPDLTARLPVAVAVDSGFDALAHAVEGAVAVRATEESRARSWRALALVRDNLPRLARGESSPEVREAMALAALLGGVNVATVSTCLPHRLQQAMGAVPKVRLSHGRGLALLYPAWLRSAYAHAPEAFDTVADVLGGRDVVHAVAALAGAVGLGGTLADHGFSERDIDACLTGMSGNLDNDPHRRVDAELLRSLYRDSVG